MAPYLVFLNLIIIFTSSSSLATSPCEVVNVPLCLNIGYKQTVFPNLLNHTSQTDARDVLIQYSSLTNIACSPMLRRFLCVLYVPPCTAIKKLLPPCRNLCLQSKSDCEPTLSMRNLKWPEILDCTKFPVSGNCIGENLTVSYVPQVNTPSAGETIDAGLFPDISNLATRATIISNATCGEQGPESYCKLVDHIRSQRAHCGICDANSIDPNEHHSIQNAIDGTNSRWQSPTIANGRNYHWVTITLDLHQVYQVAYVIIKAGNAPRPGNWILERSLDDITYDAWQYYAISDSDCLRIYNVTPTVGVPRYKRDSDVICTSFYSRLTPLENGEVYTSLINGRPSAHRPTKELLDFTRARYVRLRLQRIRTLNADLMIIGDGLKGDPSVTNRYFYSIKDISVGGQCICYGHARQCETDKLTGENQCHCEGNTCGHSCELCCPLFNQRPWRPGTYGSDSHCIACNCFGHADECVYNETVATMKLSLNADGFYEGGGVCVGCQHNTMGINCELCVDGYYRPTGVDLHDTNACIPCYCDPIGSTGLCIKDDSQIGDGKKAGDCICKEGYCGSLCDECEPGYRGYPYCEPCPCNKAGSTNVDVCEGSCTCKPNVCGDNCDQCLPGHYNLRVDNPDGCTPCFCFDLSSDCNSSVWRAEKISGIDDWLLTDDFNSIEMGVNTNDDNSLTATSEHLALLGSTGYWQAPKRFLENKIPSYGGVLEFVFSYTIDSLTAKENNAELFVGNDDVIVESVGQRLGRSGLFYYPENLKNVILLNLTEHGWLHLSASSKDKGKPVSRQEFMMALANIERLLLRATYHLHQTESRLFSASLDIASATGEGQVMAGVEICGCPEGYSGTSCEMCSQGYRRVGNILMKGTCELCSCNGHSESCDQYTGECLECRDNTRGMHCELCAYGYHGDPVTGSCEPCHCPSEPSSNQYFAEECATANDGGYECKCKIGYAGYLCDRCEIGYYGDPMEGKACQQCLCNNHTDDCDDLTGICTHCDGNTHGDRCELCDEGYYGDPTTADCQACSCSEFGSEHAICDNVTGECVCMPHYIGRNCSTCEEEYGGVEIGCEPCDCNVDGSTSAICDPVSGQCPCKPGVTGRYCNTCTPGFFGFSEYGCTECACNGNGSVSLVCDAKSGKCSCLANVVGDNCDTCQENHWNMQEGQGCEACNCNDIGSVNQDCNQSNGQCDCQPGVAGRSCDQCAKGYFGFSSDGCQECPVCPIDGLVCDPNTGDCVCPPHTTGKLCEKCEENHWGYNITTGCQPCNCSSIGSKTMQCDLISGRCQCNSGFAGTQCDQCPFGQWGFPFCAPCGCNSAGTNPETCDEQGTCQCDADRICQCKPNVIGQRCDQCRNETFELAADNPNGCTSCFCFFRTKECKQATNYYLSQLKIPMRTVSVGIEASSQPTLDEFTVVPLDSDDVLLSTIDANEPIYWLLPSNLNGDRTLSYNGWLTYKRSVEKVARVDDNSVADVMNESMPLPLSVLVGGEYVKLSLSYVGPWQDELEEQRILLREDLWVDDKGRDVSREIFMIALQHVQSWLVLVSTDGHISSILFQGGTLDTAVQASSSSTGRAIGIEECKCPIGYTGLSCQDPAPGYYLPPNPPALTNGSLNIKNSVGSSNPCSCNDHAQLCDRMTGICLNCSHHTAGKHCELCASGFHGNALNGTPNDCKKCACPLSDLSNNFSPTCHSVNNSYYLCDACQEGYAGDKCERCAPGYYGTPSVRGKTCVPCECNPNGIKPNSTCDPVTGQCVCSEGILGRACDQCASRYAVVSGKCQSCDEGCTSSAMQDLDTMERNLESTNTSVAIAAPWARLNSLDSKIDEYSEAVKTLDSSLLQTLTNESSSVTNISHSAHTLAAKANNENERNKKNVDKLKASASQLAPSIWATQKELEDVVQVLKAYVDSQLTNHSKVGLSNDTVFSALLETALESGQKIRRSNISIIASSIIRELGAAEKLRANTRLLLFKYPLNVEKTQKTINFTTEKLFDLQNQSSSANSTTGFTENQYNPRLTDQIAILKNLTLNVSNSVKEVAKVIKDSSYQNSVATPSLLNETIGNYKDTLNMLEQLNENSHKNLMQKVDLLSLAENLTSASIKQAHLHADNLTKEAAALESIFNETRLAASEPLRAAEAYASTVGALNDAEEASNKAKLSTEKALFEINTAGGSPLPRQAYAAWNISFALNSTAESLKEKRAAIKLSLDGKIAKQDDVASTLAKIQDILKSVMVPELSTITATEILANARSVQAKSDKIIDKMKAISANVGTIQANVSNMQAGAIREIKDLHDVVANATATVNAVVADINNVKTTMASLDETSKRAKEMHKNLKESADELREKIRLAREQAQSIRISLYNPGSCARHYEPQLESGIVNTISFHFKTQNPDVNQLLFLLLASPTSNNYLAVELFERRIRFSWNIGAGYANLPHTTIIQAADQTSRNGWYKVEATRLGNQFKLNVGVSKQLSEMVEVTSLGPQSTTQLVLGKESRVYLGGSSNTVQLPSEIESHVFMGCIGDVFLNGSPIGLYNFRGLEGSGCDGCQAPPLTAVDSSSYQLDGSGYVKLPQVRIYSPEWYEVSLQFKTFWREALLFFIANDTTEDFMGLEIREGKVAFHIGFGGKSILTLATSNTYNTNTWVSVSARRSKLDALLEVNEEQVKQTAQGVSVSRLQLTNSELFIGGVPAKVNVTRYGLTSMSFLGCLKNVQLGSRGTTLQNFFDGLYAGISAGCNSQRWSQVGLEDGSKVELPNTALPFSANVALSFRTTSPDGLLLLAYGTQPDVFYSVALTDGRMNAWFGTGTGKEVTKLKSTDRFDDGKVHSLSINRNDKNVVMYIDNKLVAEGQLPLGTSTIDVSQSAPGGLHIGNLPSDVNADAMVASKKPFSGCVKDVVVNEQVQTFGEPVSFQHADIGRCNRGNNTHDLPALPQYTTLSTPATITLPKLIATTTPMTTISTPTPTACGVAVPENYTPGSAAFGGVLRSHAEMTFDQKNINENFQLTFNFRNYYSTGLLMYVTNELQTDLIGMQIEDSKVEVIYWFQGAIRKLRSTVFVSDGEWHSLQLVKDYETIILLVDQEIPLTDRIAARIDVIAPLYVGGLPKVFMPRSGTVMTESYKGCMSDMKMNDEIYDIMNSKAIMGVRPCFSEVEPGAHFSGFGYVFYAERYNISSEFRISLQFRTIKEEGILLTASSGTGDSALALEVYDGKVKFTAVSSRVKLTVESNVCRHCICNNIWHTISLHLRANSVTLILDSEEPKVATAPFNFRPLRLRRDLYIGGFQPFATPQAALTTKEKFRGCMKNVVINGAAMHWHTVYQLYDVYVSSCPLVK